MRPSLETSDEQTSRVTGVADRAQLRHARSRSVSPIRADERFTRLRAENHLECSALERPATRLRDADIGTRAIGILITPDDIERRLAARASVRNEGAGRPSAVLIPMFHGVAGTRAVAHQTHGHHATLMAASTAFPGGSRDGHETPVQTALREAQEEVGIEPRDVRVLGTLDDLVTITGFVITPVVGWIPHPYTYRPNPTEVALTVELPVRAFLDPPRAQTLLREGLRRIVLAFEVDGHFVWGATASILRNLVAVIHPFVDQRHEFARSPTALTSRQRPAKRSGRRVGPRRNGLCLCRARTRCSARSRTAALATPSAGSLPRSCMAYLPQCGAALDAPCSSASLRVPALSRSSIRSAIGACTITSYEILALDRVPPRAAVHAAVDTLKRDRSSGLGGFANAVLRRVATERREPIASDVRVQLAVASVPASIRESMAEGLGDREAVDRVLRAMFFADGRRRRTGLQSNRTNARALVGRGCAEEIPDSHRSKSGKISPWSLPRNMARGGLARHHSVS